MQDEIGLYPLTALRGHGILGRIFLAFLQTRDFEQQLERLLEMEQFIKMTWDQVLDGDLLPQTVLEVK